MSKYDLKYPAVEDLRRVAKRRMPAFAFEYLDSATGRQLGQQRNRDAFDAIQFLPDILKGEITPDLSTTFMGTTYDMPFGIAPVGMSGMIWPRAEKQLATEAARRNIPYGLSTVAAALPEETGPLAQGRGWFQFYPIGDMEVSADILRRAKESQFHTLIVTVDVPAESRRERQRRAQLDMPFKFTPWVMYQIVTHPHWALAMAAAGKPDMKLMNGYMNKQQQQTDGFQHAGRALRCYPDWDYLKKIRDLWDGPMIVKGVMDPAQVAPLKKCGVDGIWVSNHSARQLEAAPASITQLPKIRAEAGAKMPIVFDSGVIGGLDILRAKALGADMVMMGKAWHFALAALGADGPAHLSHVLEADIISNMGQMGITTLDDLPAKLVADTVP